MHGQRSRVDHADYPVGQRQNALGVPVVADESLDELLHVARREDRLRWASPSAGRRRRVIGLGSGAQGVHHAAWTSDSAMDSHFSKNRLKNEGISQQ
jgi:hypothetical protein